MTANPIYDQVEAAARDAANRLKTVAENADKKYEVRGFGPVAQQVVKHWFDNAGDEPEHQAMCSHVSESPQVVFSAANFPGVCLCADCFNQMWSDYTGLMMSLGRGRPCDGCHGFADEGKTAVMSVGPMLMTVSLCMVCCAIDDAGAPQ